MPLGAALLLGPAGCRGAAAVAPPTSAGPGAGEIVYERTLGDHAGLYLVPAGGGVERPLLLPPGDDTLPRWTPDGRAVLFTSERSGRPQLWEVPAGGGEPRRVRSNAHTESQADPSPDGKRIAFLSDADGSQCLWILERATGEARVLVRHGKDSILGNPHWSPDGGRIVFSSNVHIGHQIYLVVVATGEVRRLSGLTSGGCEPRFSRDGGKVVYVSRGHRRPTSRLVEHDLARGEERALVDWPALNYDPVYSPDGAEIAFASNITGEWVVYRQALADGRSWRVTFGPGAARSPDYRPALP
ncbi:MAG TPA: hypothetical protein VN375_12200 [Vicinamibacteria bacterium]|nr:hypothetical protein [Vicinamibacteria bacterium]